MLCTFSRSVSKFLCVPVCVCVCVCMCLCACACVLDACVHMCVCKYICMHMQHIASISLCKVCNPNPERKDQGTKHTRPQLTGVHSQQGAGQLSL